jgi:hypothetical protein
MTQAKAKGGANKTFIVKVSKYLIVQATGNIFWQVPSFFISPPSILRLTTAPPPPRLNFDCKMFWAVL